MAITKDATRVEAGQALSSMNTQAVNAINQLKGLKTNLLALRTKVTGDVVNFTTDDITEINTVMADLNLQIKTI